MKELKWTAHAKFKMRYYGLSESRVKSVLRNPERTEEGIAENTVAMMQTNKTSNKPYEIWVMINKLKVKRSKLKIGNSKEDIRIISAWKYPGITKPGEPLPKAILREFKEVI